MAPGAGNLATEEISSGTRTNIWTPDNRLASVTLPSSDESSFLYNAAGQRVFKEDPTGTSRFVWDVRNVLAQSNSDGVPQSLYTLHPQRFGNLLSQHRDAESHFHLFDALGSTNSLTNNLQTVTDRFLYQAYGSFAYRFGTTQSSYNWVGRLGYVWDELLEEHYVRERWYTPKIGTWVTRDYFDNLGFSNAYSYVFNNPLLYTDPSGLFPEFDPYRSPSLTPVEPLPPGAAATAITAKSVFAAIAWGCLLGGGVGISANHLTQNFKEYVLDHAHREIEPSEDLCGALAGCVIGTGIGVGYLVGQAKGAALGGLASLIPAYFICRYCARHGITPAICCPFNAVHDFAVKPALDFVVDLFE